VTAMVRYPELGSKIGHTAHITNIDGEKEDWLILDEVRVQQNEGKIVALQKLEAKNRMIEFRLGYYMIGKKPKFKDRWVWAQYCPMMPEDVFRQVVQLAKDKGWL